MKHVFIPVNKDTNRHADKVMTVALRIGTQATITWLSDLIEKDRRTTRKIVDAMGLFIDPETGFLAEKERQGR
ncbi:MAG: hypothetical protein QNK37_03390 [Acidobacteriota bacterium]|nr:hypothetical protein [Acidobacteriota bacterium]